MVDRRSGVCTESVRSLRLWVAVQTTGPETSRLDEIQGGSRTAKLAEKDTFVQQELIPSTLQPVWASHAKPATRVDWSGYGMIVDRLSCPHVGKKDVLVACPDSFAVRAFLNDVAWYRRQPLLNGEHPHQEARRRRTCRAVRGGTAALRCAGRSLCRDKQCNYRGTDGMDAAGDGG
jgi:hypothetical protein